MTHPDFAQLAEQEELVDLQANSDDLPELGEVCPTMVKIRKDVQIIMAIETRIEHLKEINGYLVKDRRDNKDILESISTCNQVLADLKA